MGFYSFSCDIAVSREEEIDTSTVCLISLLEFFGPPFFTVFPDSNTLIHSFWLFSWTFSFCFFKDFFFWIWTIFKVFIKLVIILLLLFMFWVFGHEAYRILALWPGTEPAPSALEGEVLTTGLPGKSQEMFSERKMAQESIDKIGIYSEGLMPRNSLKPTW